jgi:Calcineurin-like phosphoesterase
VRQDASHELDSCFKVWDWSWALISCRWLVGFVVASTLALGCAPSVRVGDDAMSDEMDGGPSADGGPDTDAGDPTESPTPGPALAGAPLLFAPTRQSFGVSALVSQAGVLKNPSLADPATLRVRVRLAGSAAWGEPALPTVRAVDLAEWSIGGLMPGTRYQYEVGVPAGDGFQRSYLGSVTTERDPGTSFSFALVTDTHIGADLTYTNQGDETVLTRTGVEIAASAPDFVVNLGDMLDFHEYGFNSPPPDASIARDAYVNYRLSFGNVLGSTPHFAVIGGWDSESGCNTPDEIERARSQRLLYLPGPTPDTYAEGGSPFEDYYAFTWGDALFVVLNVFTYTPTCHLLSTDPGLPDDWTLGPAQLEFLRGTLAAATSKWRFLLIHHPVGGNAGDADDSAYGRGGGRAAYVGEQAMVHSLMLEYGVQTFFYGHDHVFTDMIVDGIHYSLPGSAGSIWPFTNDETGYTQSWPDSGWARIDVTPDTAHVAYHALGGTVLYEYTLN